MVLIFFERMLFGALQHATPPRLQSDFTPPLAVPRERLIKLNLPCMDFADDAVTALGSIIGAAGKQNQPQRRSSTCDADRCPKACD